MIFLQGMRMHILMNLSTPTNKLSCPFRVVAKPPTKSMEMLSQGLMGTGKGWYRPCFLLLGLLVHQSIHLVIYRATFSCILGHVIAQTVGWAKPDPIHWMMITVGEFTHYHLS